jgi:geranylgeranyl diphosphate synthase type II
MATCCALGGRLESVLRSAAVLELYHNAFLIHDDVEDGSEQRRESPTLHRKHGIPIAVNVGDAMLALTLRPLLDNMATVGLGKALRILQVIADMARESAEGQAIELDWIRRGRWDLTDADYVRMVYKKTSRYTFVTPTLVGAIVANAETRRLPALRRFASLLGVAFRSRRRPQPDGRARDLRKGDRRRPVEGKHTLILLHTMRTLIRPSGRARARSSASRVRSAAPRTSNLASCSRTWSGGRLTPHAAELIRTRRAGPQRRTAARRRRGHPFLLRDRRVGQRALCARRRAALGVAQAEVARHGGLVCPSVHRDFLDRLVGFRRRARPLIGVPCRINRISEGPAGGGHATAGLYLRNVESRTHSLRGRPPARQARNELEGRLYDVLARRRAST